jgi:N-acetylmuramoyl-L-alanine amidase
VILALLGSLHARDLESVHVFVGQDHARVLILTDAEVMGARTESRPGLGGGGEGLLLLPRTELDERLDQAYARRDGALDIPVQAGGVERVLLSESKGAVEVRVQLDRSREVSVTSLGEVGLLLDLRIVGADEDPSLPDAELLVDWAEGVSLARKSADVSKPRRLVVVDPGHGGEDPGAMSLSGLREADVALQLSERVARALRERLDVDVVMTREDDTFIPLRDRAAMANALDADLFLSIHANAAPGPTAWGITTFSMDTASDKAAARVASRENAIVAESEEPMDRLFAQLSVAGTNRLSAELAAQVQAHVVERLSAVYGSDQIRDLGSQTALFYVLVSTRMPAVLYEASFLTHPDDETRLRLPRFQEETAQGIVDAVQAFFLSQQHDP